MPVFLTTEVWEDANAGKRERGGLCNRRGTPVPGFPSRLCRLLVLVLFPLTSTVLRFTTGYWQRRLTTVLQEFSTDE